MHGHGSAFQELTSGTSALIAQTRLAVLDVISRTAYLILLLVPSETGQVSAAPRFTRREECSGGAQCLSLSQQCHFRRNALHAGGALPSSSTPSCGMRVACGSVSEAGCTRSSLDMMQRGAYSNPR